MLFTGREAARQERKRRKRKRSGLRAVKRIGDRIVFLIIYIQALGAGGIYLYSKINKWRLREEMTVFLYPAYSVLLFIFVLLSFFLSLFYFARKNSGIKRIYAAFPVLTVVMLAALANIFFNEGKLRNYNFNHFQTQRQEIVEQVTGGRLRPEDGVVRLPDKLQNEEAARGGVVYTVSCHGKKGLFFCTFSGVLDNMAGFVYLTEEKADKNCLNNIIILHEKYADNWYFCGTN